MAVNSIRMAVNSSHTNCPCSQMKAEREWCWQSPTKISMELWVENTPITPDPLPLPIAPIEPIKPIDPSQSQTTPTSTHHAPYTTHHTPHNKRSAWSCGSRTPQSRRPPPRSRSHPSSRSSPGRLIRVSAKPSTQQSNFQTLHPAPYTVTPEPLTPHPTPPAPLPPSLPLPLPIAPIGLRIYGF